MDIQLFQITVSDRSSGEPLTIAAGRRSHDEFYVRLVEHFTVSLTLPSAESLARSIRWMALRNRTRAIKAGPVYVRNVGTGPGDMLKFEIGFTEDAYLYFDIGGTEIVCNAWDTDTLLHALTRFAEDVDAVGQAVAPPPQPNLPLWMRWRPMYAPLSIFDAIDGGPYR
jgi:hypothetical protein